MAGDDNAPRFYLNPGVRPACGQRAAAAPVAQPPPLQAGNGESRNVLLVMQATVQGSESAFVPLGVRSGRYSKTYTATSEELNIFDRVTAEPIVTRHVQPWMLADYDTVVFEQVCDVKTSSPRFLKALVAWLAAGHKLILHDADKCGTNPIDYSWLPYRFKSDNPGALGAPGAVLRVVENNWMGHTLRARPGFVDAGAWVALKPPANELGDSNAVIQWDSGWCGHMVVRNANGIFGFVQAGNRELVAPRVKVALGATTTLKIAIKNGQLVLE